MKLHKELRYVRQRTIARCFALDRARSLTVTGVAAVLLLTSCTSRTATHPTAGLVTIQTAVTCPAPPSHTPVAVPLRSFISPPRLTLGHNVGYCAYIDTVGGLISVVILAKKQQLRRTLGDILTHPTQLTRSGYKAPYGIAIASGVYLSMLLPSVLG